MPPPPEQAAGRKGMQGADQGQVRKLEGELDPEPAPPDPWPDPLGLQGGRGGKRIGRRGAGEKQGQAGEDTGEGVVVNFENILHLAIGTVSTWHRELVEYEWIEQPHVSRHLLHPAHLRFLLQHSGGPCCPPWRHWGRGEGSWKCVNYLSLLLGVSKFHN